MSEKTEDLGRRVVATDTRYPLDMYTHVRCPKCGAPPGYRCETPSGGNPDRTHALRRAAALEGAP